MAGLFNILKVTVSEDKICAHVLVNPGMPLMTSEDIEMCIRDSILITLVGLLRKMGKTPLQFLRHETSGKSGTKRGLQPVSYTHLDVYKRQHTYTLREACPNALGLYKGVTYDGTTYTVVTTRCV